MALGPIIFSAHPGFSGGLERKGMPMNKAKLGNKLTCSNCGAKFYDLKKKQPVCPKCGEEYVVQKPKTRRAPASTEPKPAAAPAPDSTDTTAGEEELITQGLEDQIVEGDNEGEGDSVMEDTSDIGGDEEDIGEVIAAVEGSSDDNS